jgi:hypothetical protein
MVYVIYHKIIKLTDTLYPHYASKRTWKITQITKTLYSLVKVKWAECRQHGHIWMQEPGKFHIYLIIKRI